MAPTASELLTAWERGAPEPAGRRALGLVALARPELQESDRDALTAGGRDAALLDLRESLFGSTIDGVLDCAGCGEPLQLSTSVDEIRVDSAAATVDALSVAGYELRYRAPRARDLAEIADEADVESALAKLIERCVLEAARSGRPVRPAELPAEVVAVLESALQEADPQADLQLAAECPACGHSSTTRFDVASFLWSELDRWAREALREIHVLASAYGWSESQILALGGRRRLYLELIEG